MLVTLTQVSTVLNLKRQNLIVYTAVQLQYSHLVLPLYLKLDTDLQGGDGCIVKAAGLPNIVGRSQFGNLNKIEIINTDGALYGSGSDIVLNGVTGNSITGKNQFLNLDASCSNSIYGNSSTVQPPSICLIPQLRYQYDSRWLDCGRIAVNSVFSNEF